MDNKEITQKGPVRARIAKTITALLGLAATLVGAAVFSWFTFKLGWIGGANISNSPVEVLGIVAGIFLTCTGVIVMGALGISCFVIESKRVSK